jgi:hypothetical protein
MLACGFDSDFKVDTIPVDLAGGEEKTIDLAFTPDEISHGTVTGLRGYFIEIEFRATKPRGQWKTPIRHASQSQPRIVLGTDWATL